MVRPEQFRSHLGRHLEQLALFVLPKGSLMQDHEDDGEGKPPSEPGSAPSTDAEDEDDGNQSCPFGGMDDSLDDISQILASHAEPSHHLLDSAPALALGWQPPHNFTPPAEDFEIDDPDFIPRREESTFRGDLFTPGWVRGYGNMKEGYCARCKVGHWVNIPSGTYEFHLTYLHGLPSTGLPLPRPSTIREVESIRENGRRRPEMYQGGRPRAVRRHWEAS